MSRKRVTRGSHQAVPQGPYLGPVDTVDVQLSVEPGEIAFSWSWLPDAVLPLYVQLWLSRGGAGFSMLYSQLVAVDATVGVAGGFVAGQTVSWYVAARSPTGELMQLTNLVTQVL